MIIYCLQVEVVNKSRKSSRRSRSRDRHRRHRDRRIKEDISAEEQKARALKKKLAALEANMGLGWEEDGGETGEVNVLLLLVGVWSSCSHSYNQVRTRDSPVHFHRENLTSVQTYTWTDYMTKQAVEV